MTLTELRVPRSVLDDRDPHSLAWRVIELVWSATEIADTPEDLEAQLTRLTSGQRALFAIHWCASEVSNGGFDQFFSNPAGALAQEAREGFVRVGNEIFASILDQVMAFFPDERPALERPRRLMQLRQLRGPDEGRFGKFEPYDDAFLGMLEEAVADMAAYVIEHPEEFVRPDSPTAG